MTSAPRVGRPPPADFPRTTPVIDGNRVTFLLFDPDATMANVVGTHNHWDLSAGVMQRDQRGVWSLEAEVPLEGSYDYKFVVDGRWEIDPRNPDRGFDHKGRINSRYQVSTSAAAEARLRRIAETLEHEPPLRGDPAARARAARAFDDLALYPVAPYAHAIRLWYKDRLAAAAKRLLRREGKAVTQCYGHGIVWTENGVNLGIDVVSARSVYDLYWGVPPEILDDLAAAIDVLLVSHVHPDHLDVPLARRVLEHGGEVWACDEVADRLPRGARGLAAGARTEARGFRVLAHEGLHVYDAGLGTPLRYFEVVTPGGTRLLHTTDHDYTAGLRHEERPDVLVAKGGGVNPTVDGVSALRSLARHLRPRLLLPGHMNELGHPVKGGREPYAVALDALRDHDGAWAVMFWGETAWLD